MIDSPSPALVDTAAPFWSRNSSISVMFTLKVCSSPVTSFSQSSGESREQFTS